MSSDLPLALLYHSEIMEKPQSTISKRKHVTDLATEIQEKILGHALQGTEVFMSNKNGAVDLRPTREILREDDFEGAWHWPDACERQNVVSAYERWADLLRNNKVLFYKSCTLVFITPQAIWRFLPSLLPHQRKIVRSIELRPFALALKYCVPWSLRERSRTQGQLPSFLPP